MNYWLKSKAYANKKFVASKPCTCVFCGTHYREGKTKVIWKDVVECLHCGHIWIVFDLKEYERWA